MEQLNYDLSNYQSHHQVNEVPDGWPDLLHESDDHISSMLGECGFALDESPPPSDFSFFNPNLQPMPEGREEARFLLNTVREWTSPRAGVIPWLLVKGGVGVGKTALLRSLIERLPRTEAIIGTERRTR